MLLSLALVGVPHWAQAADHGKPGNEQQFIDEFSGRPAPAEQEAPPATSPTSQAEHEATTPGSVDDLFATPPAPANAPPVPGQRDSEPRSTDALFGTESSPAVPQPDTATQQLPPPASNVRWSGLFRNELAYTYAGDEHWSKFSNTLDIAATGRAAGSIPWKLGGRLVYDPIYDLTNYYNAEVSRDQRFEVMVREAYFDYSAWDWDFRLGRQHIIWGEMAGLFFADVVSAKDFREFILPDFDIIRIPQWSARAEYFKGDFHAEAVWIPYMTYDNIGKPGADFYPFDPPEYPDSTAVILDEDKPTDLSDSAYGVRLSYLHKGWDLSGFYYTPTDPAAAFKRLTALSAPTVYYQPTHERIHQVGVTVGKDLRSMVLKAEAVYTRDKLVYTTRLSDADGLVRQDLFDYIVGFEWSFPQETRFNLQLFQRWFPNHDPGMVQDRTESGYSLLLSSEALHPRLEPEMQLIHGLNRGDWLAKVKLTWRLDGNWRLRAGADIFSGPATSLLGQFNDQDRVYTEVRYTF